VSDRLPAVLDFLETHREAALLGLKDFLRFPSVSADPVCGGHMSACAEWLARQLQAAGLSTEVADTDGHPIVLAFNQHRAGRPTVLLYGHYDVQPPDPVNAWTTRPFEPDVRKTPAGTDAIYARGAADDKGQIWAHVQAMTAWEAAGGGLPINVIVLLEGEEEVDSHHLPDFVNANRARLKADVAVISDTNCFARGVPAIVTGLRGLVYGQVTLRAAANDLHSGIHGGAVRNPAIALAKLLAALVDESGRVTLDGFYDGVHSPADDQRKAWASLSFDESNYAESLGLAQGAATLAGEAGFSTLERRWVRPTCDICGVTAGYQGPGAKTIIPAYASAKVSFRLVAGQDPLKVRAAFEDFVRGHCPPGLSVNVDHFAAAPAVQTSQDSPWMKAAINALHLGFGARPVMIHEGLTIPVVHLLKRSLGLDSLLIGFGLPDDAPHAPNEKFDLGSLWGGTRSAANLYEFIAASHD